MAGKTCVKSLENVKVGLGAREIENGTDLYA